MLSAFAVRRFYGVVTARAMPGRFLHATSISMEDILTNGCKIRGLPADLGPALLNGKRHQSPHMLEIEWSEDEWRKPVMQANSDSQSDVSERVDLTMPGTAFAKINCVKDYDGNIRLFRPSTTLDRFHANCQKQGIPGFEPRQLLDCIAKLLWVDSAWIPDAYGYSMDISLKTTAGATMEDGSLVCVLNPRPPRNRWAFTAKVLNSSAACDVAEQNTVTLNGDNFQCTSDNGDAIFMVIDKEGTGKLELLTAPVDPSKSTVLRSSVLQLADEDSEATVTVTEKLVSLEEALGYIRSGQAKEVFATVSHCIHPVKNIDHAGGSVPIGNVVTVTSKLDEEINQIKYGNHTCSSDWTTIITSS